MAQMLHVRTDGEMTARHEIAHALMAHHCGAAVKSIAVDFEVGEGEMVADGLSTYKSRMLVSLAGMANDAICTGSSFRLWHKRTESDAAGAFKARRDFRRKKANDYKAIAKAADYCRRFLVRPDIRDQAESLLQTLIEQGGVIEFDIIEHPDGSVTDRVLQKAKPRQSASFRRLMKSNEEFWKNEGLL